MPDQPLCRITVPGPGGKPRRSKVTKSWPDVTGFLPGTGRGIVVECKLPGKVPRPDQAALHERLQACGVLVVVAHSVAELVADCFAGSGTTLAVAHRCGRRAVGCDSRTSQVELSCRRLATVQPDLPFDAAEAGL